MSENEKEKYWASVNTKFDTYYSFATKAYPTNNAISDIIYNNVISTKGLLLTSSNLIRNEIMKSNDNILIKKYSDWLSLKEYLGKLQKFSKPALAQMGIKVDSLQTKADQLEKELSSQSDVFANDRKLNQTTWKDIQQNLKPNEAAVEFFQFKNYNKKNIDAVYYCALIIKPGYLHPKFIKLFTEEELEKKLIVKEEQINFQIVRVSDYVAQKEENKSLYELVWEPIDSILKGTENIFISSTGLLNKIAFNILADNENKKLIDKYDLHFINSTKSIAKGKQNTITKSKTVAIFGGINYDVDVDEMKKNAIPYNNDATLIASRSSIKDTLSGSSWNYLSGTLKETTKIEQFFKNNNWSSTFYTGSLANEEAFKTLKGYKSPEIIHVSTHGYFSPDPSITIDGQIKHTKGNIFQNSANPLYRSGLILAGGNCAWQGGNTIEGVEDGVLTAYEVTNLYLGNTDLVVLSACETGLGDIKGGEGVFGLQRSFQVAGAQSVIMSLWQVPDDETTELMCSFYTKWFESGDKHQAFRNAQLEMAKKNEPYFWAAFVMTE